MPHAPFRLLRTVAVAATVLGLAAGAHLLAGGSLPVPPIMAALLALHILVSTAATRFRLNLPAMTALLAGSQMVLHQAFESLSHGARLAAGGGGEALSHHGMSAEAHAAALLAQTTAAPGLETMGHAGAMGGWMLMAHAASTMAAAALLAYGENALWALANWLRPLYRGAAVALSLPVDPEGGGFVVRPLPSLPWRNVRPNTRRGPPARSAIFA